jgi:putative membrane protein
VKEKIKSNEKRISNFLEWLIYMVGYSLILVTVSMIFPNTIQIDNSYYGLWALIASVVIYILNKTIKPIIVRFTIPITALTLGIFYPFINVIILKIVDLILGNHFTINGIFIACFAAILISIMNMIMDKLVIKPVIGKEQ